jgi:glycosyltransferase involved in cell wall biosynthesis
MKILVVQDYLRSGGTERQSILLANAFAAAGHGTTLLTFRPGGALAGTVAPSVNQVSLQPFDLGLDWFAPGLGATAAREQPDVILCMGRMANCQGGALAASVPRAKVVTTMRTGKPLPARFRRSLEASHHTVANSNEARDTLIKSHGVPAEKISVIRNALVFPADASSRERRAELRARFGAGPDTMVLLCVAMFRPEKNQRELIETVSGLPAPLDWQLWLAGTGPARGGCETLVDEKRLGARVRFLGFERNPGALYAAADLAVHASWSEALSNFLIEAQAHGLPFVAYEAQGIAECGVPNQTGWVIARGDRAGFRAVIQQRMREGAPTRAERAAAASRFARETFDPARQVQAYLERFASLASAAPSADG